MSEQFKKYMDYIASYNLEVQCAMSGPTDAKIAFVGEYPGENEVAFNKPFSGGAGKLLWNTLRKFKILRPEVYTTNVIKRRVGPKTPVSNHELSMWQDGLQYELHQLHNLELIVCLGNAAMNALLGFDGITKYRGSVYDYEDSKVLCANNPAMILRRPDTEIIFIKDMSRIDEIMSGDFKEHQIRPIINPSYSDAMDYMDMIARNHDKFSVDIEVTGMETACIGLGISPHDAMCINFRDQTSNCRTVEEEFNLLKRFAFLTDNDNLEVIAQNGNFDAYFMGYKDNVVFKVDFDTLLAHHTLYPRLPHNLGFLTSQYTTHPHYKEDKAIYKEGGDINSFWEYNCKDAAITYAVAEKLKEELIDQNLYDFFMEQVASMQIHLSTSTKTGVLVDVERKQELHNELSGEIDKLRDKFDKAVHLATNNNEYFVNPGSPKQVTKLLFDELNCKASKRSADAATREQILEDPRTSVEVKNVITSLDKFVTERKFFSTYVATELDEDNRFRAEFKQYGVSKAPGRLSSGQTLWGTGGNAQNQPRRAYEMYIPDEGCVFIYFDLAQAEARYVGWDAEIDQWIEDFERARLDGSFDAHRALAATMFNMDYDDVPIKDEIDGVFTKRYIAKRCRHGLNYRMHIARLAATTGLTYMQAAQNYYLYHRTNPELKEWWDKLIHEVKRTKMQFNCFGRRNLFLERLNNDGALDSVVAFKPQSSIGDKTQRVWRQCHSDDRWNMSKARIALNIHDALYGISIPSYAKTALSIMKAYAEEPLLIKSTMSGKTRQMIIPADCKMSVAGEDGVHRMSTMKNIDIEAVRI